MRAIRAGAKEYIPLPPDPDLIAAVLEAGRRGGTCGLRRGRTGRAAIRQDHRLRLDLFAGRQENRAMHGVLQFPHIAWPVVALDRFPRGVA